MKISIKLLIKLRHIDEFYKFLIGRRQGTVGSGNRPTIEADKQLVYQSEKAQLAQ